MKNFTLIAASLMLAATSFANDKKAVPAAPAGNKSKPAAVTLKVDPASSKVVWTGKKVAGSHTGSVPVKSGEFEFKNNGVTKGEVVIDLSALTVSDVENPEYNKKLVDHLKHEDFFNTEKFPTASYKIESVQEVKNITPGQPNALAKGKLTIRGITKSYDAKIFFNPKDDGYEVKGKLEIDRTQYGLKYNSKKFFDAKALGDKVISDKFEVDLDLIAKK